jgi:hypothetical protein
MTTESTAKKGSARMLIFRFRTIKNPLRKIFHIDLSQGEPQPRNIYKPLENKLTLRLAKTRTLMINCIRASDKLKSSKGSNHQNIREIHFCPREDTTAKWIKFQIKTISCRVIGMIDMEPIYVQLFLMNSPKQAKQLHPKRHIQI